MTRHVRLAPTAAVIRAEEDGLWQDAAAALAGARADAADLCRRAEQEYAAQVEAGYEAGRAAAAAEMFTIVARTAKQAERHLAAMQAALPSLVCAAVEQILGSFSDEELLRRSVAHAVARTRRASTATLRVPPEKLEAIRAAVSSMADGAEGIFVEADATLPPDGCVLSSAYGVAELGPAAQLRTFAARLTVALQQDPST